MAKEVATLDRLSGGRVLFGIGGGWNAEEMAEPQTEWKSRWRLLRERVLAMKEIWTKREAEFHGEFVNFDKIWADPKPIAEAPPADHHRRRRRDDVRSRRGVRRRLDADHAAPTSPVEKIPELRERLKKAGPRSQIGPVSIFFAPPKKPALDALEAAGVERAIFGVPSEPRDAVLKRLDGFAAAMRG